MNVVENASIMPIIGKDGKLLGVTIGGITLERPEDNSSLGFFAETVLEKIITLPRDIESQKAKYLIEKDNDRIVELKKMQ